MNAFIGLLILCGIIYGIFIDGTFWKLYGALVLAWFIIVILRNNTRENTKRKSILVSTWGSK